ncbi:MAG: Ni/Fe hydrogenase subunit alpha [Anaerolineaceae bacterium]|nr:Ni/Fe hydrogenase subunit alpha [Anaerolineaceae bacterium]
MTKLTFPISRIEGHAQVVIEVEEGQVISSYFQATEIRGFSRFVEGTPSEQMPVITPRICGVCSTAHQVASVKALEDAFGVTPPPIAKKIRELVLLGQLIQNQATSLFIFTMPDRLDVPSIFHSLKSSQIAVKGICDNIAHCSLRVRKAGTDMITLAGGQFIHPIKTMVGGVTSGIAKEKAQKMIEELETIIPVVRILFNHYWQLSMSLKDRIGTWGDDEPTHYITSTRPIKPSFDTDLIRILSPAGEELDTFPANEFRNHLVFSNTEYSYAGQSSYKGHILRANSLARINMMEKLGTPIADSYLKRMERAFGLPAHPILLFDLCRGIELIYAFERSIEILREPLDDEETSVPYTPQDGEGYGMVEAPRGPLIHHYSIENGKISQAEFIIPTVHNILAIERALTVAAKRYIKNGEINLELEKAVGRVVRAFDPCIACATQ